MAVCIIAITEFQFEGGFRSNAEEGKRSDSSHCSFEDPRSPKFHHSTHQGEFEEGLFRAHYAPN